MAAAKSGVKQRVGREGTRKKEKIQTIWRNRKKGKRGKTAAGKPSRHGTGLGMFVKNRTAAPPEEGRGGGWRRASR